jgi:hypothetical protein
MGEGTRQGTGLLLPGERIIGKAGPAFWNFWTAIQKRKWRMC